MYGQEEVFHGCRPLDRDPPPRGGPVSMAEVLDELDRAMPHLRLGRQDSDPWTVGPAPVWSEAGAHPVGV